MDVLEIINSLPLDKKLQVEDLLGLNIINEIQESDGVFVKKDGIIQILDTEISVNLKDKFSKIFPEEIKSKFVFATNPKTNKSDFIAIYTIDGLKLDEDVIEYDTFGYKWRKDNGFIGMTDQSFFKSKIKTLDDLKLLLIKSKVEECPRTLPCKALVEKIIEIPINKHLLLSKEEKFLKFESFKANMDSELFNIFKDKEKMEIDVQNNGNIRFAVEIDEGSLSDEVNKKAVEARRHFATKLDAVDGEATFVYLMNPIFEHLGFDKRFFVDGRCFEKMGDNGDYRYGTQRIDIKTRQKSKNNYRYNLLVNEDVIVKGFNEFGLVHREGDHSLKGKQRRLTFVGVARLEQVTSEPAKKINGGMKFEVQINELESLRNLILRVCTEVLEKEEK